MLSFTDTTLSGGNTIRTAHVSELRDEIRLASLFVPHLDERPVKSAHVEYGHATANTEHTVVDVAGAGCLRSMHFVTSNIADSGRARVYIDGESTPRVDVTLRELAFALSAPSFWNDYFGFTNANSGTAGGAYRLQPMPFHTNLKVTFTSTVNCTYWADVLYNHSTTVDFNYGRYNYFNWAKASGTVSGAASAPAVWQTLASATTKKGAIYGIYHYMEGGWNFWEGNYEFLCDGVASCYGTGTEDFYQSAYGFAALTDSGLDGQNQNLPSHIKKFQSAFVGLTCYDESHVDSGAESGPFYWGAYRLFHNSPLVFDSSFSVKWQNGGNYFPVEASVSQGHVLYYTED